MTEKDQQTMVEHHYETRVLDETQLQNEIEALWHDLQHDPAWRAEAEKQGIPVERVVGVGWREAIGVRRDAAGLDPVSTALVVSFSPVLAGIVRDVWERLLLPRLERRYGGGALTERPRDGD